MFTDMMAEDDNASMDRSNPPHRHSERFHPRNPNIAARLCKANLRKACLDRVRRNRRDAVMRKRLDRNNTHLTTFNCDVDDGEEQHHARKVVGEELIRHRIRIKSPHEENDNNSPYTALMNVETEAQAFPMEVSATGEQFTVLSGRSSYDDDDDARCISEDELQEILLDVEDELRRDEELFIEEILEAEHLEQLYMQEQIEEFDHWQEAMAVGESDEDPVLCPICMSSNLLESSDQSIICPKIHDGSCSFLLPAAMNRTLPVLRDQLQRTHAAHSQTCTGVMRFSSQCHDGTASLSASCDHCDAIFLIV